MAHDVFISHSEKDKVTADAVCAMLESNGIRCWIAPRDVLPSMAWGPAIVDAIGQCRIMVLVLTANANDSSQIPREVERAVSRGVAILPLRVEDVLPGKGLEFFIGNVHWLDALTPPLETHLKNLAGKIKILLAPTEPVASPTLPQEERLPVNRGRRAAEDAFEDAGRRERAPAPRHFWGARAWTWAAGTVTVLLLVAVFIGVHFTSHPAPIDSPKPAAVSAPATPSPNGPGGTAPATPAAAPTQGAPPSGDATMPNGSPGQSQSPQEGADFGHESKWIPRNSGTTQYLHSISGTGDARRLWAVGQNGTILESDDGGATWAEHNSGTTNDLQSIFGTNDGLRLWAVGQRGTILESDDGGATWTARKSGITSTLYSIFGTSDGLRLWGIGQKGTILESDDGGTSWMTRNSGTKSNLFSILGTGDVKHLWVVGERGTILESDDGGASWTARNSGTREQLQLVFGISDGKRLWAVGHGGAILESDDGGASWTARNSGTKWHLSSVFGTSDGKRLRAVCANDKILESDDSGASWAARDSGTTNALISIFGTSDGKRLWAVGESGTIVESSR